jgi:hypothetical protein
MAEYRSADPQPVPEILFDRQLMVRPERVLSSSFWDVFHTDEGSPEAFRRRLALDVVASFGSAFVTETSSS